VDHFNNIYKWDIEQLPHRDLKVVTMVSNPIRFKTRYNLYRRFAKHMEDSGVDLITVEIQQGERPFAVTDANNPNHVQLRTYTEIWLKECALNLAAKRLYELHPDWKYLAWIDADIQFLNPGWAAEALSILQRFRVIQLWSTAIDLDYKMNPIQTIKSFAWCHWESLRNPETMGVFVNGKHEFNKGIPDWKMYAAIVKPFWHSGFAWAMRREVYENLGGCYDGGIFETGILGSGDHHMALAFINEVERSLPKTINKRYLDLLLEYQNRCNKFVQRELGYIDGGITHYFHGTKQNRGYRTRWSILADNKFDPTYDLKRDKNGLFTLTDRSIKLRDDIKLYFESRDEDNPNT
jgi:hypothetical protein